jgi:serine/threonine-protein kinase
VVYKAFDPMHHRFLALKILGDDILVSKEKRARFKRETQAARILSHPAIAGVYEAGEHDGWAYIAMEYVDGHSYRDIIAENPEGVSRERFLGLTLPVLDGVSYAQEHGLLHRDLKPDNLKEDKDGHPKVLDFGLVKFLNKESKPTGESSHESFETVAGSVLGSAGYMSPEQAQGDPLDAATDVFSLAVIMYELLSGQNPFQGRNPFETIVKVINNDPLSLELLRPDLPVALCKTVHTALAKDPVGRFGNARDFHRAISAVAS